MSEIDRNDIVSSTIYTAGDQPGHGNTSFKIRFRSNWFKRGYVIESPGVGGIVPVQVLIESDPIPVAGGHEWEYTVRLVAAGMDEFCPLTEIQSGRQWAQMWAPVSQSDSVSPGGGNRVSPGKAQNQMMMIRAKREWGGNVANRAILFKVPGPNGNMSDYWIDYDMWTFEREWNMAKETSMWYSHYNKLSDGTISLKDPNSGSPIPQGAGLLEQIPNVFTYSKLTYNRLKQIIMDVFYGQTDTDGQSVILMTGLGGIDEFDLAMKEHLNNDVQYAWNTTNDKVVEGSGANMSINGFFSKVYFIGGYNVTVVRNPVFDYGRRAVKSEKHPITGLPLESYRMVFLDSSNYDGEANIKYVHEKGREYDQKIIKGIAALPMSLRSQDKNPSVVQDEKDASSVHRYGTCGVVMMRPSKSLHGICTIS